MKTYVELQDESGIKLGQRVKIVRGLKEARDMGWTTLWNSDMNREVGMTGKVISQGTSAGFRVKMDLVKMDLTKEKWSFPFNCLVPYDVKMRVKSGDAEDTITISQDLLFAMKEGNKLEILEISYDS